MDPTDETPSQPASGADTGAPAGADTPSEASTPAPAGDGPKSMLEAINAGIAASIDGPLVLPEDDAPSDEPKPTAQPKPTDEPKPQPADPKAAKPAGKEPLPGAEPLPKPKPAKAPEPAGPIDPVNDPIPPEVKGRTRERMTALIGNVRQVSTERDQAIGERDEILGYIQQTGASPEQYTQALQVLQLINSRDPAQIRQVIGFMQQQVAELAGMIGEPVAGVDMLRQHADLQAAVAEGKISHEHAQEIAAARALRASQERQGQQHTQQQQQAQAVNTAKASLNRVELELRNSDPLYEAKKAVLVPTLQPIFDALPPAQWEQAFRKAYARLTLPAGVLPPARIAAPNGASREPLRTQQPLRATRHAGNAQREAGSMLDAINEGIEMGSRRR